MILDEPMSELDPVGRREVRDIIQELKNEGKTVMFSTHILSDAEMLCDRVGVIVGSVRSPGLPLPSFSQSIVILIQTLTPRKQGPLKKNSHLLTSIDHGRSPSD